MMRRSKLKVRPAIRKSQPTSQDSAKAATKAPEQAASVSCNENTISPVSVQNVHAQEIICNTNEETPSVQNINNDSIPESKTEVNDSKESTSISKPPLSASRRRKLVACPKMGKKRKTLSNEPSVKQTREAKEPVATFNSVQEKIVDTISIKLPHIETIRMPIMVTPLSAEVTASEESSTDFITLTPVTASTFEENNTEAMSLEEEPKPQNEDISTGTVTLPPNLDNNLSITIPDSTLPSQQQVSPHSEVSSPKKSDVTSAKVSREIEKKVIEHISKPKFVSQKPQSRIDVHRRNAKEKLKKLKENQEDAGEWPELDQNLVSMSDLIYLNPPSKIGLTLGMNADRKRAEEEILLSKNEQTVTNQAQEPVPDESQSEEKDDAPLPVPQIRIADDGSVVIDEESVVLDTQKPVDPKMTTVFEFGKEGMINQCSFLRRPIPRPSRWSDEETNKFYKCLCIVGAEFSLMGAMFRARSVDDLRRKFKRERKKNPSRIDKALMQQHLSKWTDDMFEPKESQNKAIDLEISPKHVEGTVT